MRRCSYTVYRNQGGNVTVGITFEHMPNAKYEEVKELVAELEEAMAEMLEAMNK